MCDEKTFAVSMVCNSRTCTFITIVICPISHLFKRCVMLLPIGSFQRLPDVSRRTLPKNGFHSVDQILTFFLQEITWKKYNHACTSGCVVKSVWRIRRHCQAPQSRMHSPLAGLWNLPRSAPLGQELNGHVFVAGKATVTRSSCNGATQSRCKAETQIEKHETWSDGTGASLGTPPRRAAKTHAALKKSSSVTKKHAALQSKPRLDNRIWATFTWKMRNYDEASVDMFNVQRSANLAIQLISREARCSCKVRMPLKMSSSKYDRGLQATDYSDFL